MHTDTTRTENTVAKISLEWAGELIAIFSYLQLGKVLQRNKRPWQCVLHLLIRVNSEMWEPQHLFEAAFMCLYIGTNYRVFLLWGHCSRFSSLFQLEPLEAAPSCPKLLFYLLLFLVRFPQWLLTKPSPKLKLVFPLTQQKKVKANTLSGFHSIFIL